MDKLDQRFSNHWDPDQYQVQCHLVPVRRENMNNILFSLSNTLYKCQDTFFCFWKYKKTTDIYAAGLTHSILLIQFGALLPSSACFNGETALLKADADVAFYLIFFLLG